MTKEGSHLMPAEEVAKKPRIAAKSHKRKKRKASKQQAAKEGARAKFPRHPLSKVLRVPRAILEQNAGHACTEAEAAAFVGVGIGGPFRVEISSAIKYGLLERPETGKIQPSALAKKILRPQSPGDDIEGYREAVLQAPDISDVYKHYRGENLPDDQFLQNTVVEIYKIPAESFGEFKQIFLESLETAQLLAKHGDKIRVIDISAEGGTAATITASNRIKKLGKSANVSAGDSCFVMQPFAAPLGDYYEKVFKPAIEKAGLNPVRADAEIFGTGKIMDQVFQGIVAAKVLVAELTTRNPNVFYELGVAHALKKPVVLVSAREEDVPFDLHHIRVIYYDVTDPFWGAKLIEKVAENILSAIQNPEEAIFKGMDAAS
jgi:hypothetical protein